MSRPTSRPTHIPLPAAPFTGRSQNGSPPPAGGMASPTSPRNSFLPSFMRARNRAATLTNQVRGANSPTTEANNPLGGGSGTSSRGGGSREASGGSSATGVTRVTSTPVGRSSNGFGEDNTVVGNVPPPTSTDRAPSKTHRIRLVPNLETSRSLAFDPVVREVLPIVVPSGVSPSVAAASFPGVGPTLNGRLPALILKIGRFTDKASPVPGPTTASGVSDNDGGATATGSGSGSGQREEMTSGTGMTIAGGGGDMCSSKVAFKSKVVSRAHAEIWCEAGGKFFIRDSASSSGTFVNHIRLSSPNIESRPTMLNDGDMLQLGVDYQGGHEDMFRCIKMRVELGREWQRGANEFNTNALRQLKALGGVTPDPKGKAAEMAGLTSTKKAKSSVTDCCICLFSVTVCQSLFIAPCSHVFHYKCIRPLLAQHHPGFSCPLCRTFANLEEDVETEDAWEIASRRASVISRRPSNHSIRFPHAVEHTVEAPGTGIGFGPASASVDELLGPDSGTASEEGGMTGMSALARQTTAVQTGETREAEDVDMPEAVREQDEAQAPGPENRDPGLPPPLSLGVVSENEGLQNGATTPTIGLDEAGTMISFEGVPTPVYDTYVNGQA